MRVNIDKKKDLLLFFDFAFDVINLFGGMEIQLALRNERGDDGFFFTS